MNFSRWMLTLSLLCWMPKAALAATYEVHDGDDLFAALGSLQPGDEVVVRSGSSACTCTKRAAAGRECGFDAGFGVGE